MGYSQLAKNRRVREERVVAPVKKVHEENVPQGHMPSYEVLFTLVVNICTCSLGSVLFAYKWFACLNYLIGKNLFKPLALTFVWTILLIAGIVSTWYVSIWLFAFIWLGHAAVVVYLLVQLRKCRTCSENVNSSQKKFFAALGLLWLVAAVVVVYCRWATILMCVPAFVIIETCMIQRIFNLAVYEALENKDSWQAKTTNDWWLFRVVVVWFIIALSILLFFWDVADTVFRIFDIYLTYHDFDLEGGFHLCWFFEEYYPHTWWQVWLWGIALLISKLPRNFIQRNSTKMGMKMSTSAKGFFTSLFPNVAKK